MTDKIKCKTADMICLLLQGKLMQAHISGKWRDCYYLGNEKVITLKGKDWGVEYNLFNFLKGVKDNLRLKHPHQDLIDQIEADPSLEQYLEIAIYTPVRFDDHGVFNGWKSVKLIDVKNDNNNRFLFKINKPKNPHQKLIDLYKANPHYIVQISDEQGIWNIYKKMRWSHSRTFRLIKQEIIIESEGVQ